METIKSTTIQTLIQIFHFNLKELEEIHSFSHSLLEEAWKTALVYSVTTVQWKGFIRFFKEQLFSFGW